METALVGCVYIYIHICIKVLYTDNGKENGNRYNKVYIYIHTYTYRGM